MRVRLYTLFFEDRKTRLHMYSVAAGIFILMGTALTVLGAKPQESASECSVITIAILSIWTLVYCSRGQLAVGGTREEMEVFSDRRSALAGILVGVAVFLGLSTENIEAAIINKRLKKIADGDSPLNDSTMGDLLGVLTNVHDNQIRVNTQILADVGKKVIDIQPATPQSVQAANLIADVQSASQYHPAPAHVRPFVPIDPSAPRYSIFDNIKFANSKVTLDTNGFMSCYFERCVIAYFGGPTVLSSDLFIGCTFQIANTEAGMELASILSKTNAVMDFKYRAEEVLPRRG
jgi:hypothetical protein